MHFLETGLCLAVEHPRAIKRPPADAVINAGIDFVHQVQTIDIVGIHEFRSFLQVLGCRMIGRILGFQHARIEPGRYAVGDFLRVLQGAGCKLFLKGRTHIAENNPRHEHQPDHDNRNHIHENFRFYRPFTTRQTISGVHNIPLHYCPISLFFY